MDNSNVDDEDNVLLGTPVNIPDDPEVSKKPIPIHEQIVTDERGRRRFHGAFTGGFSAGYFNTVGSKEGREASSTCSKSWQAGLPRHSFLQEHRRLRMLRARKFPRELKILWMMKILQVTCSP